MRKGTQAHRYEGTRRAGKRERGYAGAPVRGYAGTQARGYARTQVRRHTGTQAPRYAGTSATIAPPATNSCTCTRHLRDASHSRVGLTHRVLIGLLLVIEDAGILINRNEGHQARDQDRGVVIGRDEDH